MKRFLESINFRIASIVTISLTLLVSPSVFSQSASKLTPLDRTIIYGIIKQFKKECGFTSSLNQQKVLEIQDSLSKNKQKMNMEQVECFDQYLGPIVGIQRIYANLCDEVTSMPKQKPDSDLARIFIGVKKFESGLRPLHEKLNDCLIHRALGQEFLVKYIDHEKNSKVFSKKIRELNTAPPFRENRVDFR